MRSRYAPLAAALPSLQPKALSMMRGRLPCPVATYRAILAETRAIDLTGEDAEPVRRRFNAYYGVRRNARWRTAFYERFERAKGGSQAPKGLFAEVLRDLNKTTGRVEASFVSKLVATLRPESPIVDSVVRGWLSERIAAPRFGGGLPAAVGYYDWLWDVMAALAATPEARAWGEVFCEAFPPAAGESPVAAIKQLDFLIWAGAER